MTTIIIRGDKTNHEKWEFSLETSHRYGEIRWESYSVESKRPRQRLWRRDGYWGRIFQRDNTIKSPPPLPPDVEAEARAYFIEQIQKLPITQ